MGKLDLEKIKIAFDLRFDKRIKELNYCYCIRGTVVQKNIDGTYQVKINETIENRVQEKNEVYYPVGTLVEMMVRNNNSSDKYILWKV